MALNLRTIPAKDGNGDAIAQGIQQHDRSGGTSGPNDPVVILIDTTGAEILGTAADTPQEDPTAVATLSQLIRGAMTLWGKRTDNKAATTDTTAVTWTAVFKQISASIQALVTNFGAAWTRGAGAADANTARVTIDTGQWGIAGPQNAAGSASVTPSTDGFPVSDAGSGLSNTFGVAGVPFASADQHSAAASVTDAPTTGQKLVIDEIIVSVDTTMSVTFTEETSGTVIFGPWYCPANSGPIQLVPRGKRKLPTINKKLQVITSVSGNINVGCSYHSEA